MGRLRSRAGAASLRVHAPQPRVRVAIVENHHLVSESLRLLLDDQQDMTVVATAASVAEAASITRAADPDVVVMDFHLGDGTGRDAALAMRPAFPLVRFVFLSRDGGDDARLAAIEAGASAYVLKTDPAERVIDAIRKAAAGVSSISPQAIARLVSKGRSRDFARESLSHREREVLQLMAAGVPTRQIGQRLGISYSTVRTHIRSISAKLGTRSMLNAVVTARELELVN